MTTNHCWTQERPKNKQGIIPITILICASTVVLFLATIAATRAEASSSSWMLAVFGLVQSWIISGIVCMKASNYGWNERESLSEIVIQDLKNRLKVEKQAKKDAEEELDSVEKENAELRTIEYDLHEECVQKQKIIQDVLEHNFEAESELIRLKEKVAPELIEEGCRLENRIEELENALGAAALSEESLTEALDEMGEHLHDACAETKKVEWELLQALNGEFTHEERLDAIRILEQKFTPQICESDALLLIIAAK